MMPKAITHGFKKILVELSKGDNSLKKNWFHDLSHSHATASLKMSVNPEIVQEILGHSSIRVTMGIYPHSIPRMQKDITKTFSISLGEVK